ncbi:GCN5-related N-acetyltransferase (GNAT) family [Cryptosporidium ryanae]|uniref:GCN5-related N-acetyltransferase (GNAT) family n=1 Tax=Cryptosporidium ryanae TaxID=515981 RepID=UPI00351A8FC6|nr:GCN5-related N-acetyltransferase (GNAT) family [Cryptosporidium ryanae]
MLAFSDFDNNKSITNVMNDNYCNRGDTTSSAFPPEIGNPKKCSETHKIYSEWRNSNPNKNPIIDFRRIVSTDIQQLADLHRELFPINYDDQFYDGISSGLTQGWVAVWKFSNFVSEKNEYYSNVNDYKTATEREDFSGNCANELIIGFITTSQDSRIIKDNDYKHVLKNIPEAYLLESLKKEIENDSFDITINSQLGENTYSHLVYILTMGVIEEFRFLGIAKQLLNIVIGYYEKFHPQVNAIFLHVVEYNKNAINLYKRLNFIQTLYWSNFYKIYGEFYGAFLFTYVYDRSNSSNSNIFDSIISNCPNVQRKNKYSLVEYLNSFISNSSKYFRRNSNNLRNTGFNGVNTIGDFK